jgi:hypothetical protein
MPVILLLALGVIAYSVSNQAKAAINQIQYTPVKVKFVKAGLFSFTFDLYFEITNNTNTSINITGIDGLLKSGATQLGTFVINKPYHSSRPAGYSSGPRYQQQHRGRKAYLSNPCK